MADTQHHLSPYNEPDLFRLAGQWTEQGHELVLVFVMQTWGSAPRQPGSIMLVRSDMTIAGSVSGGCIEGAVIDSCMEVLDTKTGKRLDFGVADETAWSLGLSCGGKISVLLVPLYKGAMPTRQIKPVLDCLHHRQAFSLLFDSDNGQLIKADTPVSSRMHDFSKLDEEKGQFLFVQHPGPHVIIIGAVHITQHLADMAGQCGFQVSVVDPREVFAAKDRFSSAVALYNQWPAEILPQLTLDKMTALITLTHDPKIDDDALIYALKAPLFYLACLGSKRTHEKRMKRLSEHGFDETQIARIHGPAGLDIRAKGPAEIAVSVLAELISAWRQKGTSQLGNMQSLPQVHNK